MAVALACSHTTAGLPCSGHPTIPTDPARHHRNRAKELPSSCPAPTQALLLLPALATGTAQQRRLQQVRLQIRWRGSPTQAVQCSSLAASPSPPWGQTLPAFSHHTPATIGPEGLVLISLSSPQPRQLIASLSAAEFQYLLCGPQAFLYPY